MLRIASTIASSRDPPSPSRWPLFFVVESTA
jgi:hypothetical protein